MYDHLFAPMTGAFCPMPKDYAALPPETVRRADRAVEDESWIRAFLHRAAIGYLATVHEGQPFINSNLFVYDEAANAIYMHTARYGRTQSNVEADPQARACFSISEVGRVLPADEALEFSVEYSGVTVFGRASLIDDVEQAKHALQLLLDKYAPHLKPGEHYRPTTDDELKRTAVYRIDIDAWSGKRKAAEPDFPGAFLYEQTGEA
jgi:nitroimidazol reductase NimA-like FMN-containing flavoprotein (pyridoxamine 5'-phosphate oxidase superfamily)